MKKFNNYHFIKISAICFLFLFFVANANSQTNLSVSACNSYTLPWNTTATTTSGVYSHTYKNIANLDSIVTINLTINVGPTTATLNSSPSPFTYLINEQFDNGTTLNAGATVVTYTPTGWYQTNKSSPLGSTNWFSGPFLSNGTPSFAPQSGAGCIVADYLNNGNSGTISNWLISPKVSLQNGDVLSFYTISNPGTPYADRMEVRMNITDTSTNVGTTATSVGSFTTTLTTINNTLASYGYPQTWTLYTITISGLAAPTTGRIAFRYFVTSGGPNGANSDMIGLDNVTLTRTSSVSLCNGNAFNLNVNVFGGASPYTTTLNNNVSGNFTTNNYVSGNNITHYPNAASTYSIVSVVDANGCAAATNLNSVAVNVSQPITTSFSASNCISYTLPWGAVAITSGTYFHTYSRSNGCDSIVNYTVTILGTTSITNVISACNSYTLPWGTSITTSGLYSQVYTGVNGCDSISNWNVTIHTSITNTINLSACNQYTLPWNNSIITTSGSYSHTYSNIFLCDSIVQLNITIHSADTIYHTLVACDSIALPWNLNVVNSGSYYHVYQNIYGCDSTDIYNVSIHNSIQTINYDTAVNAYVLPWNVTVSNSGVYTHGYTTSFGCDSTVTKYVYIYPAVQVNAKAILSGPFNTANNLMNDSLRVLGLLPTNEPYSAAPYNTIFTHVNGGGGEVAGAGVFAVAGNNAIVDWVLLELRSAADSTLVVATKSALIQRDGDIVSAADGISPVTFNNTIPGFYFLSIRHRNHFGIMTRNKILLNAVPSILNFTNTSIDLFTKPSKLGNPAPFTGATRIINGERTLYSGNVNISLFNAAQKYITYNTQNISDRLALYNVTNGVNTITGYTIFDADLNGFARYNGYYPDRLVIYTNCLNSNMTIIFEQIP